jgi:predicted homoserine dehydrogenase-like protein
VLTKLKKRQLAGKPIRVALIGAGSMGLGIAHQVSATPGMEIAAICDIDLQAAATAARACGKPFRLVSAQDGAVKRDQTVVCSNPFFLFERKAEFGLDLLLEATNTIGLAARSSMAAIASGMHVVLMNAEVDLALGPLLHDLARRTGVVVTSDAGDQHGVLLRQIKEIELLGLDIVMAGNIKGFLDRSATPQSIAHEARIRHLNPVQCCAYTDGTKLGVEMALVSNATGLATFTPGMEGPRARRVEEVMGLFDFDKYGPNGVVDYILGAEPGGGVFVVGRTRDKLRRQYLSYYKMGDGPYYLFYRPYHLCHLETPLAIASAVIEGKSILEPTFDRVSDVFAYAKRELKAGECLRTAIGGDQLYGLVDDRRRAEGQNHIPITMLESDDGQQARVLRDLKCGEPLRQGDVEIPPTPTRELFRRQDQLLAAKNRLGQDEQS